MQDLPSSSNDLKECIMKHKAQCDDVGATLSIGSTCAHDLSSFSKRWNTASGHGNLVSNAAAATAPFNESPALQYLHEGLPLSALRSWKLYENPFFVDGKLAPKYVSRYLNAPVDHTANSFSPASIPSQDNAPALAASNENGSLNSYRAHSTSLLPQLPSAMAPAHSFSGNVLSSAFWQHHELHRISQSEEATIPSDLVNQAQPLCLVPCVESLKCPSLHLDCQVPYTNIKGEEHCINQSKANMAACSIQTTLANILQRLRILEENQSRNNSVIAKLRLEMEDGSSRIQELEFSHESVLTEINCLLQRFGEQIATSRRKEQEKLRAAFVRLREEIEEERNTCRLLKLQNKKLMKELDEANIMAADAGEELDRERQARELMEEVCNELAREIGEDKAEVEQLKQEQAKSIQIVEEELKLIRMASLWRDERVKAKLSQVQFEHDDKRHVGVSLADLKSRVEEFVSSVSAASGEPYKAPSSIHKVNKDELKQMKMIEQAKLLRQALELSIQPVAGDGGLSQAHNDMDLKEEKSMTPIIEGQPIHTDACDCCINTIDDCKNLSMRYNGSYCELQVRPTNSMPNYSKKPSRDIRRPRMVVGDGLLDQNTTIIPHARRHLKSQHDIDVETEQECGPRRILLNSSFSQAAHQSPNPDFILYEGDGIRLAACKHKEQGSLTAVSIGGRGELCQGNELGFESSNCTPCMKEMVHRKQITLHFEGSEDSNEENAEAWEDDLTPNVGSAQGCSEDDASYACMDEQSGFSTRQQNRRGHPASCQHMKKQANGIHPWKSSGIHEEHLRRGHGGIDYHVDCLMQHEYDVAKSICADEAESGEGEHGEFDGFYFEPVIDDGSREDHQMTHHAHEPDVNGHMSVADHDDEPVDASPRANDRAVQHSRSSKELALKSVLHDSGGGWTSARSSAKTSRREEAPPPLPPHKLVLPTPSAIRVPSVKALYTSPRSAARSLSPSKAQVLQCFRPSPTSPEHNSAKLTSPVSSKNATKGEGMGTQHTGGSSGSWASKACLLRASSNNRAFDRMREEEDAHCANEEIGEQGQGKEACGSSRGLEEKKGNSLRAELIKARELDLQQYGEHGNVNAKNAAAEAPPSAAAANKSASSSLRLSPIRRSLTSSSSQTSR